MRKDILKIIVDEEEYSISEDKKHITSSKKKFTTEEFKEEIEKKIPFIAAPKEAETDGKIYAFSSEEKFEEWLKKKELYENYERHKELVKKLKKEKSPKEKEKIEMYQKKQVEEDTEKYKKFLEKNNLKHDQHEKIIEILEDQDSHFKKPLHSLYLFDGTWWTGAYIALAGGHQYCYKRYSRAYPDLGYFGFDNRAESASLSCGSYAYCYTDKWYGGARFYVGCNLVNFWFLFSYFGNSVSSAIVY